jgi:hypothetical protein
MLQTGIGELCNRVVRMGGRVPEATKGYLLDSTFATLTNVNFDSHRFEGYLRQGTLPCILPYNHTNDEPAFVLPAATHRDALRTTFISMGGNPDTLSSAASFAYQVNTYVLHASVQET